MGNNRGWQQGWWQWGSTGEVLAMVMLVVLGAMGTPLAAAEGWLACPPQVMELAGGTSRKRQGRCKHEEFAWQAGWNWLKRSWQVTAVRSEAIWLLVVWQEGRAWAWLLLLPWALWLWQAVGVSWPRLRQQGWYWGLRRLLEQSGRVTLPGLGVIGLGQEALWLENGCGSTAGLVKGR